MCVISSRMKTLTNTNIIHRHVLYLERLTSFPGGYALFNHKISSTCSSLVISSVISFSHSKRIQDTPAPRTGHLAVAIMRITIIMKRVYLLPTSSGRKKTLTNFPPFSKPFPSYPTLKTTMLALETLKNLLSQPLKRSSLTVKKHVCGNPKD